MKPMSVSAQTVKEVVRDVAREVARIQAGRPKRLRDGTFMAGTRLVSFGSRQRLLFRQRTESIKLRSPVSARGSRVSLGCLEGWVKLKSKRPIGWRSAVPMP
jgi:hypothetical protein